MKNFKLLAYVLTAVLLVSCGDDEEPSSTLYNETGKGLIILNEGIYERTMSTLSYYDPEKHSGEALEEVFFNANRRPIGMGLQSMTMIDGKGWFVCTDSGSVLVVNTSTFEQEGSIIGMSDPRYIANVSGNKLYITSRSVDESCIYIADKSTMKVTGKISTGKSATGKTLTTEQIEVSGGYAYVSCWSNGDRILKVNVATDQIIETLPVQFEPKDMKIDKNGYLWVYSDGGYYGQPEYTVPAIQKIDLAKFEVAGTYPFDMAGLWVERMTIDPAGENLYYVVNSLWGGTSYDPGVYKMSVTDTSLPADPFIANENGGSLYSVTVSPYNGDVYVSDAIDNEQNGLVYRFDRNGKKIDQFRIGINPGWMYFK